MTMLFKQIIILQDGIDIDDLDVNRQFFNCSLSKAIKMYRKEYPLCDGLIIGYTGEIWQYIGRVKDIVL